jgi:hypothetical protein
MCARFILGFMFDLGLFVTCQGISRQLTAMHNEFSWIRLIHSVTRKAAPGKTLRPLARLRVPDEKMAEIKPEQSTQPEQSQEHQP